MISKQLLLGGGLLLGGSIALVALTTQKDSTPTTPKAQTARAAETAVPRPKVEPITAD